MLLDKVFGKLFNKKYEPEHSEKVDHDIVMAMVDGKLVEVTSDDFKVRKQIK